MSLALRGTVVGDRGNRLHAQAGRAEAPTQRRSLDRRLAKNRAPLRACASSILAGGIPLD